MLIDRCLLILKGEPGEYIEAYSFICFLFDPPRRGVGRYAAD